MENFILLKRQIDITNRETVIKGTTGLKTNHNLMKAYKFVQVRLFYTHILTLSLNLFIEHYFLKI